MRIAWFSPMPPSRSGIAAYSAEILPLLRSRLDAIDVFVDRDPRFDEVATFAARDFVWMHRRHPYDLAVYQVGNALCHGYMWAYFLRYPGLVVLHDAQLHQARALWLLRRAHPRYEHYPIEFAATETAAPEVADVIAAGLGEAAFYQHWPMVRLVLERARLTVVHNQWLKDDLAQRYPQAAIDAIDMGVADPLGGGGPWQGRRSSAAMEVMRSSSEAEVVTLAAFGGITPEKRIPALLRAAGELRDRLPDLRVLLVGEEAKHYDVRADAALCGIGNKVTITGYVPDEELPRYLASADICSCLRWPTNRETSASWLRCLAAGKPTLITALAQYVNLPDIAVQIDLLDEQRELPRAIEALARDAEYRTKLGAAARQHWEAHHQLANMAAGYLRAIEHAVTRPAGTPDLPLHMRDDGSAVLRAVAAEVRVTNALADLLD